jgi:hypothetical protein
MSMGPERPRFRVTALFAFPVFPIWHHIFLLSVRTLEVAVAATFASRGAWSPYCSHLHT